MKKVVVIGGGFAGVCVARELEKKFTVTLIDTKDYFEFTPSVLRTIVEPNHLKKIEVLHSSYLARATLIRSKVVEVSKKEVITSDQGKFEYDYLVVCSGSRYAAPIKDSHMVIATRGKELRRHATQLEDAQSVLLIGGGIVGVELAAEIITHYPKKVVMLAHSRDELVNRNPTRVRKYVQRFLEKRNVKIHWNSYISKQEGKKCYTKDNVCLESEMIFLCTGITPNSEFLSKHFSKSLTKRGFLEVNEFLQVKGSTNVFAAGDVTAIKEEKTAQTAERHAKVVAYNIQQLCKEKNELIGYAYKARPMIISLGKWDGVLVYKNFSFTGFLPGVLKRFVEWKEMRQFR